MKLLIDIPDGVLESKHYCQYFGVWSDKLSATIENGTPLPGGHGDLIDKSKICKAIPAEEDNCTGMGMTLDERDAYNEGIDVMYSLVQGAKPIIEADMKKGSAE